MTLLMREREKYREGYIEGKAKGIIDILLELGYSCEDILSILQKKLHITANQAEDYLKKFNKGTL